MLEGAGKACMRTPLRTFLLYSAFFTLFSTLNFISTGFIQALGFEKRMELMNRKGGIQT